jgi:ATP-binding cassette, subfamily B, multidrug efflux pump
MGDIFRRISLFSLIYKYRALFLRYRLQLVLGILALLFTNLLGIAIPWQIKQVVDTIQRIFSESVNTQGPGSMLWGDFHQTLWLIAGLATLVLISRIASRQFLLGAGRQVEFDLRNHLFAHLLKMPTSYFAAHPPGELMSRMTNDVDATKYLTGGGIMLGVNTLLAYVMAIPMLLIINWKLALVTFLFYPLVIFLMSRISKKVRQGYHEVQEVLADISTVAQENLNGIMVIQSYVREAHESKRFEAVCDRYYGSYTRLIHERILLFMLLAGLSGLSMLLVLMVGGWEVIAGQLDWGGFVAFTMYLEHLAWPTMALGWTISIFQQGTAALERIDDVLSVESNIQSPNDSSTQEQDVQGEVEIRNLTFHYRNPYSQQKDEQWVALLHKPVLTDINLKINPGETVALVGPVGSGKSTLLRLLPRLLEVPEGTIFLDGRDITQQDLDSLRSSLVFMPQLNFLFSTTVTQNIAFGNPQVLKQAEDGSIPEPDIIQAAQTASVHLDILDLPKQYQTLVGERGLMLSGGQRQRVSLARAILLDAKVLILDDPFSNVDAETERNIVSALKARQTFHNKTTLLATHRFSLVVLCDRVMLMDEGRIVAIGTHAELLATQPLYQRLHRLQELKSTLGDWELQTGAERLNGTHISGSDGFEEVMEGVGDG